MNSPETTRIVMIGHVDHGKSTLIGRLLYDLGQISEDRLEEVKKEATAATFDLAHLVDQFREEREENKTIDTTQVPLQIDQRPFVLIDAPGHKEYLKNMITGATQADHAILVVDITEGVREQTRKHLQLLRIFGINSVVLAVNKMDRVDFSESEFRRLEKILDALLDEFKIIPKAVVPIAALSGDNVASRSSRMNWYQGPDICQIFTSLFPVAPVEVGADFRFPVQLVHSLKGESFLLGRVEQGHLDEGAEISLFPSGDRDVVSKILTYGHRKKYASLGESVALLLKNNSRPQRGDVVCGGPNQPKGARSVVALIYWGHSQLLKVGDRIEIGCRTQKAGASVTHLSEELASDDVAEAELELGGPFLVGTTRESPSLSRFVIQKEENVIGCGVITHVRHA